MRGKQLSGYRRNRLASGRWHQGQGRACAPKERGHARRRAGGPGKTFGLGQYQGVDVGLAQQSLGALAWHVTHGWSSYLP
jgi:hypothetical protein